MITWISAERRKQMRWFPCVALVLATTISPSYSFSVCLLRGGHLEAMSFAGSIQLRNQFFSRSLIKPTRQPIQRLFGNGIIGIKSAMSAYTEVADEAGWLLANVDGECSVEKAMYCGLAQSTEMASLLVGYMEECNELGKRIPQPAADVLRSLLSHQVGAQGFWTMFLTDPDLRYATEAPFDPSLLSALARFPELNMGVLSSCLAMSATEETVYSAVHLILGQNNTKCAAPSAILTTCNLLRKRRDGEEMMRENAATSRLRVLKLLAAATKQPDSLAGDHGGSWLLDLIDYDLLEQCVETAELRGLNVESGTVLEPATGIFQRSIPFVKRNRRQVPTPSKTAPTPISKESAEPSSSAGGASPRGVQQNEAAMDDLQLAGMGENNMAMVDKRKKESTIPIFGQLFGKIASLVTEESVKDKKSSSR